MLSPWRALGGAVALAAASGVAAAWAEPAWVERAYARGVYPAVAAGVGALSGAVPFSLTELAQALGIVGGVAFLALGARRPRAWAWLGTAAALAYPLFLGLWGLNYRREPLATTLGLGVRDSDAAELRALGTAWAARANAEWLPLEVDPTVYARAAAVYREAGLPWLPAPPVAPKPLLASAAYSRIGILGFFFPFTGEAHVNAETPPAVLPWTALHELAHQQGFAQEDEASFVGVWVGRASADRAFRYSAAFFVVFRVMDAMRADPEGMRAVQHALAPGVVADLEAWGRFLRGQSPTLSRVADRVNDTYLKAQGVPDGARSYGRVVDLLLADARAGGPERGLGPGAR